jgi:hypothetical protein
MLERNELLTSYEKCSQPVRNVSNRFSTVELHWRYIQPDVELSCLDGTSGAVITKWADISGHPVTFSSFKYLNVHCFIVTSFFELKSS